MKTTIACWLKVASAALVVALGSGQAALAWSPEPWSFDRDQEEGLNEILEKAEAAHRDDGDLGKAYEILSRASNLQDSEEIRFWRAWYASELGDANAKNIYQSLISERSDRWWGKALEVGADFFNVDSKYGKYHNALGYFLLVSEGHAGLEKAYYHLDKALETAPKDPARLHSYGYALQKDGRLKEAQGWYEDALDALERESDVDFIFSDYASVSLRARPGDYCSFARAVRKMLAHRTSALRLCTETFYEEMADLLDRYVRRHPNSARPKAFHALLLHKLGEEDRAKERLREAKVIILRQNSRFYTDDVEVYGLVAHEMGKSDETVPLFESLVEAEPENPWHRIRLACVLVERGDNGDDDDDARQLAYDAHILSPDREDIIDLQAEIQKTRIARSKGEERRCRQ